MSTSLEKLTRLESPLVFLDLLEGQADGVSQCRLRNAQFLAPLTNAKAKRDVEGVGFSRQGFGIHD